jgi:probable HAF family extracellular repeat protein
MLFPPTAPWWSAWLADPEGLVTPFRWTASGGMQYLDALYNDRSEARGVSANGAVVVGGPWRAFRWTPATGMQDLGHLGGSYSVAYGVSANGAVVVGGANNARYERRAFRWTASGGMQDLGHLGGSYSEAYGVSADGSVVVGWAYNAAGQRRAFRWTASVGDMENLYATYGNLLTPGSVLEVARAISPDGRYIVGWGINAATGRREAFLLDTGRGRPRCNGDVNGDGRVDDADLLEVLFNFGNQCP